MNLFSISEMQQFSGIKAHTIRIWEQRYNALNPTRTEGNTRHYDDIQLRRLLNIVSLMEADHKVSALCKMPDYELHQLLEQRLVNTTDTHSKEGYYVSQLIAAGMNYDEVYFEKIFSNCLLRFGLKDTYINVIYPMLNRIGLMWASDSISTSYEHFITNLIKQKFYAAIDSLPPATSTENSWLLFLPENEFHEIGLLFSNYLIRQAGKKVVYLGSNVPFITILATIKQVIPKNILFFTVHNDLIENIQSFIMTLQNNVADSTIHISGNEKLINTLSGKVENIHLIQSVDAIENFLHKN